MSNVVLSGPPASAYGVRGIPVPVRDWAMLEPLVGSARFDELKEAAGATRGKLDGRVIWNVSSTAEGGGVAEMLHVLVGYALSAGFDVRWLVMRGDQEFFAITKRIHNRLHGASGDGRELGAAEAAHYARVTAATAQSVTEVVRPGDVVLLHDPQTAGMAPQLARAGVKVVWRCHIGRAEANEWTEQAWSILQEHIADCDGYIFSLREYVPAWVDETKVWIIPPSIDPFSPKNEEVGRDVVVRTLQQIGLLTGGNGDRAVSFTRRDGTRSTVRRAASIVSAPGCELGPDAPLVVQVSRWDRLKDMPGVMEGFADGVAGRGDAHLALVGPSPNDVSDDPEELDVFQECMAAWNALSGEAQRRVRLVTLPMEDMDENAAMVNAVQRHATVVVQKSLEEGFGLTVAEAMWKSRAVVASGVGGIARQIAPGTGILLRDATDLTTFGSTLADLLKDPYEIASLGARARQHVLEDFVGDRHLKDYANLIAWLL